MAGLQTEYEFTLPKGFVDGEGRLHRHGTMRLATARDEIEPLRDPRIDGPEDPYLTVLVLARVITSLGTVGTVSVADVERLFAADLAFLQDLYGVINFGDPADVPALQRSVLAAAGVTLDEADAFDTFDVFDGGASDGHDDLVADPVDATATELDAVAATNGSPSAAAAGAPRRRRDRIEEIHRDGP